VGGGGCFSNLAGQTVEQTLFAIHCTTCQTRLNVRSAAAIGQILTCPKCDSMIEVAPPPGWQAKKESAPKKVEAKTRAAAIAPGLAKSAEQRPEPRPHKTPEPADEAVEPTPAETAKAAEAEEAAAWGMAPMGVAPAELLWRK